MVLTSGGVKAEIKNCFVCNKACHKYKGRDEKEHLSYRIIQ